MTYGSMAQSSSGNENEDVGVEYFIPIASRKGLFEKTPPKSQNRKRQIDENRSISPWMWRKDDEIESEFPYHDNQAEMMEGDTAVNKRNTGAADLRLSMLSNFSTSYNVLSISLALHMMDNVYEIQHNERTLCSSALIAGMIIGQLVGGTLGDWVGRHMAMTLVMFLQVFAALASAFSFDPHLLNPQLRLGELKSTEFGCNIFHVLAVWRLLEGIGCGGVYPLAATLSAESSDRKQDRAKFVALTFSMQGVGYLSVPLVAWVLIKLFGEQSDYSWRLLLGLGCVPGIMVTVLRQGKRRKSSDENTNLNPSSHHDALEQNESKKPKEQSLLNAILSEPDLSRKLIGTAGCWFIFDVMFYGNTLFQPVVLSAVFGAAETLENVARDSSLLAIMALPGYFVTVLVLGSQSPRRIQLQGFVVMLVLYVVISIQFDALASQRQVLLLLYGLTFFFSDYGPNTTTFMLPSMTFSPECRSTLNGLCAASGKVGALLGAILFEPAAKVYGNSAVMMFCAFLSLVGLIMTLTTVHPDVGFGESLPSSAVVRTDSFYRRSRSMPSFLDYGE